MTELKHRIEDSLSATRAAIEEGIVVGGGAALVNCMSALNSESIPEKIDVDEAVGVEILRRVLREPLTRS